MHNRHIEVSGFWNGFNLSQCDAIKLLYETIQQLNPHQRILLTSVFNPANGVKYKNLNEFRLRLEASLSQFNKIVVVSWEPEFSLVEFALNPDVVTVGWHKSSKILFPAWLSLVKYQGDINNPLYYSNLDAPFPVNGSRNKFLYCYRNQVIYRELIAKFLEKKNLLVDCLPLSHHRFIQSITVRSLVIKLFRCHVSQKVVNKHSKSCFYWLALESNIIDSYISEKLFRSIMYSAAPIYIGAALNPEYYNTTSILQFYSYLQFFEWIKKGCHKSIQFNESISLITPKFKQLISPQNLKISLASFLI